VQLFQSAVFSADWMSEYQSPAGKEATGDFPFASQPSEASPQKKGLLIGPGSRESLIRRNLPIWLSVLKGWQESDPFSETLVPFRILVPQRWKSLAQTLTQNSDLPKSLSWEVVSESLPALEKSSAGILHPGTFTLTAYRAGLSFQCWAVVEPFTFWRAKKVLKFPWASLPNLILNQEVIFEWVHSPRGWKKGGIPRKWPLLGEKALRNSHQPEFKRIPIQFPSDCTAAESLDLPNIPTAI
jgi:lipid A disaccharide synthetase